MSKYEVYPAYKDSGVEWLGEVPINWLVLPIKYLLQDKKGSVRTGPFGSHLKNSDMQEDGMTKVINQKNVISNDLSSVKHFLDKKKSEELASFQIYKNDLLVTTRGTIGRTIIVKEDLGKAILHPCLIRLQTQQTKVLNKLLSILIQDSEYVLEQILVKSNATTIEVIYSDGLINIDIAIPNNIEEQTAIINFLDRETTKIDTLIEKQQELIGLLKEKRQAVISHAVTKGVKVNGEAREGALGYDPSAKMKDSGVVWLGEVPEHWEVVKLKYNLTLQSNKVKIDNHQVIALENIEGWSGKYVQTDSKYQGEDVEFQEGDILFGKLRPYLAKVFKCQNNGIAFGDILVYRPMKHTVSGFAFYALVSDAFIDIVDGSTYGSKMPRASVDFVSDMPLATPPYKEQQQITNYLNTQTDKIDTLIEKANQAIILLKERRTALISAAVTGKIDVRGEAA